MNKKIQDELRRKMENKIKENSYLDFSKNNSLYEVWNVVTYQLWDNLWDQLRKYVYIKS